MKIACIVLAVIAAVLGIVILVLLLNDRKKTATAANPNTSSAASENPTNVTVAPVVVSVQFHKPFVASEKRNNLAPKEPIPNAAEPATKNSPSTPSHGKTIKK